MQIAEGLAVPRQLVAVAVDDLHLHAVDGAALALEHLLPGFVRQAVVLAHQLAGGAQRRHLGHAPGVDHLHAERIERADHGRRARRAADHRTAERRKLQALALHVLQQAEPHRRHAGGEAHLLLLEQFVQRGAVQLRPRKHQLGAHQRHRIRQAPGIDVEHRHHRQDHVLRRAAQRIGQRRPIRMQHGGAVRIQRPLRIAGRARRVAQAGGGVLVEQRPGVLGALRGQQVFVAQHRHAGGRHVRAVGHRHPALDVRAMRREALDQRHEGQVEEDVLIIGVVDDVGDLVGEQARIDGVAHRARARHAIVDLQVPVAVPGQRADALAGLHAERGQRIRQLLGAIAHGRVRGAMELTPIALHAARHDFGRTVVPRGMFDDGRDEQGRAHHVSHQGHGVSSKN